MRTQPGAATAADVVRGDDQIEQGRLDGVVVIAPDDAFLIGMHGALHLAVCLGFVGPLGCLLELGDGYAGDLAAFIQAHLVGGGGLIETLGALGNEVAVYPALLDHIGEQAVEQGHVGAGLDVQVQHPVLQLPTRRC